MPILAMCLFKMGQCVLPTYQWKTFGMQVTHDISHLTSAAFLNSVGTKVSSFSMKLLLHTLHI